MKYILEPKVRIVAHTQFHPHPDYPIPDDGTDATKLCAFAAKGCYSAFGKNGRTNLDNQLAILEHRHGSVMEHFYVTFFIEGISRALTLELNRHRLLNISQQSTRYVDEGDAAIVLEPYYAELYKKYFNVSSEPLTRVDFMMANDESKEYRIIDRFIKSAIDSLNEYNVEVELLMKLNPNNLSGFDLRKWCRGKARNLLPHSLETKATYTANLRAWRWIIEVRSGKGAEPEIRRLANLLVLELKKIAPTHFADFEISEIYDGIPVWMPKYEKV